MLLVCRCSIVTVSAVKGVGLDTADNARLGYFKRTRVGTVGIVNILPPLPDTKKPVPLGPAFSFSLPRPGFGSAWRAGSSRDGQMRSIGIKPSRPINSWFQSRKSRSGPVKPCWHLTRIRHLHPDQSPHTPDEFPRSQYPLLHQRHTSARYRLHCQ